MIFGIGLDIVEVGRVERQLAREAGLMEQLFTPGEIAFCRSHTPAGPLFAACFAAKEAFLKALGTGLRAGIALTEVAISPAGSALRLELTGSARDQVERRGVTGCHVSMTHQPSVASAIVILEI